VIWETKGEAERPGAWPGRSGAPLGVGPAAGGEECFGKRRVEDLDVPMWGVWGERLGSTTVQWGKGK